MKKIMIELSVLLGFVASGFSQEVVHSDSVSSSASSGDSVVYKVPSGALQKIELLDFKSTDIKDIIRGLATKYNLNIFVEDEIQQRITLRLSDITIDEALRFITKEYGLRLVLEGNIYKIIKPKIQNQPVVPKPVLVTFQNGLLSLDVKGENIQDVVRAIAEASGKNIIIKKGVEGQITGYLQNTLFEKGLMTLMTNNGFFIHKKEDIYVVDHHLFQATDGTNKTGGHFWVYVQDSLITLDVVEGNLNQIIREIATQLNVDVFSYGDLKGNVNAQCSGVAFEKVLNYLFKGTNYTYRREGDIYFIGDKDISGISSTQLIRLNHIKAEGIIESLPPSVTSKATLKVIKEHNALMVVGAQDVIREVEEFIRQIDYPIPQILIEALVVDFTSSDIGEFGMKAWMKSPGDSSVYADSFFPTIDVTASSRNLNQSFQYYGPQFGIRNIGKLPDGFMVKLRALESEGKANIRSQPQIATLNGHPASIKIGTTQYYKLLSERPIVGGNQAFNQVTQRFEAITAEISLTITPWVSASGEITTEIKPEFSTPRGFNPEIPPTIDHRNLDSTVRLRDGETIILGGLIQTDDSENVDKLPILGDIPVMGKLFQNRSHKRVKTKLMIYITPHLTYTDDVRPVQGIIQ